MSTLFRTKNPKSKKPNVGSTTEVDVSYEKGLGEGAPGKQSFVMGTLRRIFPQKRGKRKSGGFWSKVRKFFANRGRGNRVSINANEIEQANKKSGAVVMPKGNSEAISSSEGMMFVTPQNAPNVNFGHESIFGTNGPKQGESFTSFAPLAEQGMDQTKDGAKQDLKMILGPMLSSGSKSNPSTAIEDTILLPTNLGSPKTESRFSDIPKRSSKDANMLKRKDTDSGNEKVLMKDGGVPPLVPKRERSKPKSAEVEIRPPVAPRKVSKKQQPPPPPEREIEYEPPPPPSPGGKSEIFIPPPPPVTNPSFIQQVVFDKMKPVSRTQKEEPTPPAKTPRRKEPEPSGVPVVTPMTSVLTEDQEALMEATKTPDIDMFLNKNKKKGLTVPKFQLVPKRAKQEEKLPAPVVLKEENQAPSKPGSLGFGNIVGKLVRPQKGLSNQQTTANASRHSEAGTEQEGEDDVMLTLLQSSKHRDEKSRSQMSLFSQSKKNRTTREGSKVSLISGDGLALRISSKDRPQPADDDDVLSILKSTNYKNSKNDL